MKIFCLLFGAPGGGGSPAPNDVIEPFDPIRLQCTASGQVRSDYPNARFVFEENLKRLGTVEEARGAVNMETLFTRAREWLRDRVFNSRKLCDPNPRHFLDIRVGSLRVRASLWRSQEEIFNCGLTDARVSMPAWQLYWTPDSTNAI